MPTSDGGVYGFKYGNGDTRDLRHRNAQAFDIDRVATDKTVRNPEGF